MQKSKKILNKDGFKLPYLGRTKFIELMKMGLEFERERNIFYIRDLNRAEEIKDSISEILNQEIAFLQTCLICGKEFLCLECKYYETCSSRDLPFHCVCKNCSIQSDLYDRYVKKTKEAQIRNDLKL